VLVLLSGVALYGTMLLLPLYWQQVRGESALGAALLLIPQGVGTLISRGLAGKYMDRFGPRPVTMAAFVLPSSPPSRSASSPPPPATSR
jgi:MFS family permease